MEAEPGPARESLNDRVQGTLGELGKILRQGILYAEYTEKNRIFRGKAGDYYSKYMEMREEQRQLLKRISPVSYTHLRGALKSLANEEGYESFVVPDDVGGRFSVLTAVGLLPIAVSGADIDKLMEGAASGRKKALEAPYKENAALMYAAVRNILLRKGKHVEIVANYEPSLHLSLIHI